MKNSSTAALLFLGLAMGASGAQAGEYSEAISGCKLAIQDEVGNVEDLKTSIRRINSKAGFKAEFDFRVSYADETGTRSKHKAKCLAKLSGEVLSLDIS